METKSLGVIIAQFKKGNVDIYKIEEKVDLLC